MPLLRVAPIVLFATIALQQAPRAQGLTFPLFEAYLESLRQQAGIPGLSAAVVTGDRTVWERGFGVQDVDRAIAASPDTPYLIGDLTQTFAAALLLQCAERGALQLDEPVWQWTSLIPEAGATVRHVLAHTSAGTPGTSFRYDPSRYAALTPVISQCTDKAYPRVLADEILDRFGMSDSVPGHDLADPSAPTRQLFGQGHLERYGAVSSRLAVPYRVDSTGRPARSEYPARGVNASTGLISTVRDLARFDVALGDGLLRPETLAAAWTTVASPTGSSFPSGLGWFVQSYNGERIVWHFGSLRDAFSSLILKIPGRDLTLILLANSDGLSASFRLSEGDVTTSLFARLFLRLFV